MGIRPGDGLYDTDASGRILLDMVIRISKVFVAVLVLIWIVLFWGKRNYKKEEKKIIDKYKL